MDFTYSVAGALTGFVVGLTGVGGGALMTPLLLLFFGIAPKTAVATDLWFAAITKLVALCVHHRGHNVDWQIVCRLWLGSLPMALAIAIGLFSGFLSGVHSELLTSIIGFAILLTALGLVCKHWLSLDIAHRALNKKKFKVFQKPLTIFAGILLGGLVSLTSIGAGALGSMILLYLYPMRLTANKLVGTDIAHAIPLSLLAGFGYCLAGHIDYNLLVALLLGSLPAALLGSLFATHLSGSKLRYLLAAILSFSALKLIFA